MVSMRHCFDVVGVSREPRLSPSALVRGAVSCAVAASFNANRRLAPIETSVRSPVRRLAEPPGEG
jgi:hypothetical protein